MLDRAEYWQRLVVAREKTDRIDAWSLVDALRLDGHTWRPLESGNSLAKKPLFRRHSPLLAARAYANSPLDTPIPARMGFSGTTPGTYPAHLAIRCVGVALDDTAAQIG